MGIESFSNIPTKESLQASLEESKKQMRTYKKRLEEAQDTPVSDLFSEGEKARAIKDHQVMVDQIGNDIDRQLKELSELN